LLQDYFYLKDPAKTEALSRYVLHKITGLILPDCSCPDNTKGGKRIKGWQKN